MYRFFFDPMITANIPIVLASTSPRRIRLLQQIGITFTSHESGVEEKIVKGLPPQDVVRTLSREKAERVAADLKRGIVIGADTIVVLDKSILGKPQSEDEAKGMLTQLSGRTHAVFTGFALIDVESKKSYIDFEKTDVTFRRLTAEEIVSYVRSGSPMDKAGAYGIQDDYGAVFVERIDGCFYNVVGLPLSKFHSALREFTAQLG